MVEGSEKMKAIKHIRSLSLFNKIMWLTSFVLIASLIDTVFFCARGFADYLAINIIEWILVMVSFSLGLLLKNKGDSGC